MPNDKVLNEKKTQVSELAEKIKSAKVVLLTDYRGINVEDVTNLRKDLRNINSDYKVIKNNITKRALEQNKIEGLDEYLEGPTSVALSYEGYSEAAKILADYAKEHKEIFKIKAGIVDGKVIDAKSVIELANLPSREVLISKMLGGMMSPISGLANVLNANISGLARVLGAIAAKQAG